MFLYFVQFILQVFFLIIVLNDIVIAFLISFASCPATWLNRFLLVLMVYKCISHDFLYTVSCHLQSFTLFLSSFAALFSCLISRARVDFLFVPDLKENSFSLSLLSVLAVGFFQTLHIRLRKFSFIPHLIVFYHKWMLNIN